MYFLERYFGVDAYAMEKVEVDPDALALNASQFGAISTVAKERRRLDFFKHDMAITLFNYHDDSLIDKFIDFCNNEELVTFTVVTWATTKMAPLY